MDKEEVIQKLEIAIIKLKEQINLSNSIYSFSIKIKADGEIYVNIDWDCTNKKK